MRNDIRTALAAGIVGIVLVGFEPVSIEIAQREVTTISQKHTGYTQDGRRHELTASSAEHDFQHGGFKLKEPRASLEVTAGNRLSLQAAAGVFEVQAQRVIMHGDVVFTSTTGKVVRMSEATIDLRNNTIVSRKPIEMTLEERTIRGNRLETYESGSMVIFEGNVVEAGNVVQFISYAVP
jgi:LPS export ABC transporter protein LptC